MSRYDRNLHAHRVVARAGYDAGGEVTPVDYAPPRPQTPVFKKLEIASGPPVEVVNPYLLPAMPRIVSPVPPGDKSLVFGRGVRVSGD
jgi:hypothetical protein